MSLDLCRDCKNHTECPMFTGDLSQYACGGFEPQEVEEGKHTNWLENEKRDREEGGIDPENGLPYEYWYIGMTRGMKKENKRRMKVYLEPCPHVILDQDIPLRGWYKSKYEPKGVRNRPCFTDALLTQPYGGTCPIRCVNCYINNGTRGYRGQGISVVDPHYPEKIAKQLDKMQYGFPLYITSFTEPFSPLEKVYHNTQRLGDAAVSRGLPVFYLSRQIPPEWAIEHLKKSKYSYMQFSINAQDRKTYKILCPGVAPLDDILACIRRLRSEGIYVSIQVNPVIPGVVEVEEVVSLIHELAAAGVNHCIFKFVEIVSPAARTMINKMKQLFPGKGDRFEQLFSETIGGMRTIQESYRKAALKVFKEECTKAGITCGLCYEYGYTYDDKGKITDKTGTSLGREHCTADQCHGQRTPLHIKNPETGLFEPFEGCPPSGCLYCEETTGNRPPCGSRFLQRATAIKHNQYNLPVGQLDAKYFPVDQDPCFICEEGEAPDCACGGTFDPESI